MKSLDFAHFGVMLDCSRNAVPNLPTLKQWVDLLSDLGYNTLMLYTEDTYEIPGEPFFGYHRGRYSLAELRELDAYAASKGVELMPCIQTLAHLNAIFRWDAYRPLVDCNDILTADDEATYALIEKMFDALESSFTSRTVNIGMDEAYMLGRGRFRDLHGCKDSFDILLQHLNRVAEIAERHGFEVLMWGDMFFRLLSDDRELQADKAALYARINSLIPKNVNLIYWDYYSLEQENYDRKIKEHAALKEDIWFAGGLWSWTGFAPHNGYSIKATEAAFAACAENGVQNCILTLWGDDGAECSKFSILPSLYYAAQLAKGNSSLHAIKAGFEERFGMPFDCFMEADLLGTPNGNPMQICNPEKYMLYNDLFSGIYDKTVRREDGASYSRSADALKKAAEDSTYGYLFKTLEILCRILSVKWDLGMKTREAYAAKDRQALLALCAAYDSLIPLLEQLHQAFSDQWMRENKPFGFEIQDLRIGGLMQRIKSCKARLLAFANGELIDIPELEEPILLFEECGQTGYRCSNLWYRNVSASIVSAGLV